MTPATETRVCLSCLGVRIDLEVTGDELADAVRHAWVDCLVEPDDAASETLTVGLTAGMVQGSSIEAVLHHLSPAVTRRAIGAQAGKLLMLHAAALADPATGAAAVIVAPSGTGKTTASRTLGAELAYVTDETAGITLDGELRPYRKPLSIIEEGHLKAQRSATELGLVLDTAPPHVGAVLVVRRDADHDETPTVELLDTVDALGALAPETSYLDRHDKPLHTLADMFRRVGGVHRVTYRESATLLPVIRELIGAGA